MKTSNTRFTRGVLLLAAVAILSWSAAGRTLADGDGWHHHDHDAWSHDDHGYWDGHGGYHAFIYHEHHHGYWREGDNGARVFINID